MADDEVTAWDPPRGAQWFPLALYGGVLSLVIWALPIPGWWNVPVLAFGWVTVVLVGSRLYAAAEYVLTPEALTRRSKGKSDSIPLKAITAIYGYDEPRVGDFIAIQSATGDFTVQLGGDINRLLEALGPRLEELGRDRQVIANEKTRRWLGLPACENARRVDSTAGPALRGLSDAL